MKNLIKGLLLMMTFVLQAQAQNADPSNSIYQLAAPLVDENGQPQPLDLDRGHPVLITMFYGGCPAACPLLIDTLRAVERELSAADRQSLRVLLITIDPEHDTPAALAALASTRKLDTTRWTLANTDAAHVRKLAAVLNIQYRQLPDGGFNHTSVITLLDPQGQIIHRSSVLGRADPELTAAIRKLAAGS